MSKHPQPVIIKKKSRHHGGHHGGAWKVAYADFVTAMMAFFLVMWLVTQSKPIKASVGAYFRDPGVFEYQRTHGLLPGGTTVDATRPEASPSASAQPPDQRALEQAASHIRDQLAQLPALKTLRSQVEFTVTGEGLRIDLVEGDKASFFDSGSAALRPETERILGVIARELSPLDHDVVVEGHTDSRQYPNPNYTNWELSTDRANAARRAMAAQGFQLARLSAVRGLADRQLRLPEAPFDARNRRVSILVKAASASVKEQAR